MGLSDRLTGEALQQEGFALISPGTAKHGRYRSYRHRCDRCGLWFKELRNECCRRCHVRRGTESVEFAAQVGGPGEPSRAPSKAYTPRTTNEQTVGRLLAVPHQQELDHDENDDPE